MHGKGFDEFLLIAACCFAGESRECAKLKRKLGSDRMRMVTECVQSLNFNKLFYNSFSAMSCYGRQNELK